MISESKATIQRLDVARAPLRRALLCAALVPTLALGGLASPQTASATAPLKATEEEQVAPEPEAAAPEGASGGPESSEGAEAVGAPVDMNDTDALNAAAVQRFQAKDFEGAAQLFERAFEIDPNPNYLFNIGRVYEQSGDINKAVDYYQRFVQSPGVELESRELALKRLRVLREIQKETQAPEQTPPPEQPPPEPEGPEPGATGPVDGGDPPGKLSTLEIAGYAVLGVGGAALIAGGVFGGLALSQQSELDSQMSFENRQEIIQSGETNALVADIMFISGGALAVAGLVMAVVGRSKRKRALAQSPRWTFSPGRQVGLVYHF